MKQFINNPTKESRRSRKCKILLREISRRGVGKRRQTDTYSKATAWLKRNSFDCVTAKVVFAWGDNTGTYRNINQTLHFLKNNWADYQYWKKEVSC